MESKYERKTSEPENRASSELVKDIKWQWSENITMLDLSNKNIADFDETVVFPPKLIDFNISRNNLRYIPAAVLNLANIKYLDLSHNSIQYFDDMPSFCQSIMELNLSHNKLEGPPYWVWTETPRNLVKINLSCNMNLTYSLTDEYVAELLQYKTLVTEVIICNCRITNYIVLLRTFSKAKSIELGSLDSSNLWTNRLEYIPCEGLDQCLEVEKLNLSNTQIYSLETNINIYKNLVEIDLSQNNISSLPNNFCCLENLEVCILSYNRILYLPEDIIRLKQLSYLRLDSNELCMLPENLHTLPNLKILDLYNNNLYEVAEEIISIEELDLAQNYLDEPEDLNYSKKKEKLRLSFPNRNNGRKHEAIPPESEDSCSSNTKEDEELNKYLDGCAIEKNQDTNDDTEQLTSLEDWDSDEYWVPRYYQREKSSESLWLHFVKRKMQEGNFCPMDLHSVPVSQKVRYEQMCNPKKWPVIEGQFDDLSSDES